MKQAGSDHITTIAALAEKAKESPWSALKIFLSVGVSSLIKYSNWIFFCSNSYEVVKVNFYQSVIKG